MRTGERYAHVKRTTPFARLAEPEEIAWPILFLCSREAGYITGCTLDVNGGATMV
ncbi:SDR family oxidoreductase [Nitrospinota bacterium]